MAIYSTFFVCEPGLLQQAFPDWKPPLAKPVQRTFKDPLTGQMKSGMSDEPSWGDDATKRGFFGRMLSAFGLGAPSKAPATAVVSMPAGVDYGTYLESRIPVSVSAQPHWCTKGLTMLELDALGELLDLAPVLHTALYCRDGSSSLDRVEPRLQAKLAALEGAELGALAERWAEALAEMDWAPEDAARYLEGIRPIARAVAEPNALYLLVEV